MKKRNLTIGSLSLDLRQDITMEAVVELMDSLIKTYAYYRDIETIWYSDGDRTIKGQDAIRALTQETK